MREGAGNGPVQAWIGPCHATQRGHDLRIQMRWREQPVPRFQALGHERVARVVSGVEDGKNRGIDDRQAHDASRTSRTAATASSAVTPVSRGTG